MVVNFIVIVTAIIVINYTKVISGFSGLAT